ncbi:MAG TPA: GWxTD domain-containing protein [Thermoanaerobaculia bacterium]|jgi:GWxTD domain-containing protein|nr:GWxTD domain-containing protein [Thermoanaerobaculia bacterium]
MAGGIRAGRRLAAALPLLSWLALGCGSAPARPPGGAGLGDGPTRWLMLPDEQRQLRHLQSSRDAIDFVETFWRRRDPDPNTPGNEFSKLFYERVEAADRLYSEGGTRGSLTDRGRALILLGPPPVLRYSQKKVPAWNPGKAGAPHAVQTHTLSLESWVYALEDLPPALQQLLQQEDPRPEIVLVFTVDPKRTYLIEGEQYLEFAVRAAVRE